MALFQSFGAAQTVTGSCHVLKLDNMTVMVDCGLYQGEGVENLNYKPFGFRPKDIDVLLITHAHLDHVGRIPKLVKEGFRGRIVSLKSTMDLAEVVLLDTAHLMEEDYKTRYKKAQRRGTEHRVRKPLYDVEDVERVYELPIEYVYYDERVKLGKGVWATFRDAGHILDSATVEISFREEGRTKRVVFSGDLGNKNDMVMPFAKQVYKADALFIESTYGDRNHKSMEETLKEFKDIVFNTLINRGNVIIPSFAIERTQEILCVLKDMYKNGELPYCKIYIDSPMAITATNLYNIYHEELSEHCNEYLKEDGSVFDFPYVKYVMKSFESKKINDEVYGCIIIAGSGMCTGGRILHHFKHRLWNRKNSVLFVGYQAKGTLGRKIVEGTKKVRIYHEEISVKARIHTLNGFSAHADQSEMIEWMRGFKKLDKIFLIHGEREKQEIFKKAIYDKLRKKAHIVELREKIFI